MWQKLKAHLWALAGNSYTILVGYGMELAGYLDEAKYVDWTSWFGAENAGKLVMVIGGVVIALRLITTTAVAFRSLHVTNGAAPATPSGVLSGAQETDSA